MSERRGEISSAFAETCKNLTCPLFQEKPYFTCQVKTEIDTAKERGNQKSRIARDYGSTIPNGCPSGYNNFRRLDKEGSF